MTPRAADAAIAQYIEGWTHVRCGPVGWSGVRPDGENVFIPGYATDVAACVRVLTALRAKGWYSCIEFVDAGVRVFMGYSDMNPPPQCEVTATDFCAAVAEAAQQVAMTIKEGT